MILIFYLTFGLIGKWLSDLLDIGIAAFTDWVDHLLTIGHVNTSQNSILAAIGSLISPIFAPLGFADWRISTALITGFMAKESVVSTLTILSAVNVLTPFTAAVFLVFTLLYTPCVAAIASVKRELGGKWAVFVVVIQCVIAWLVAFAVHLAGMGFGLG